MTKEIYCLGTEKKKGIETGVSAFVVGTGFFAMFFFPGAVYMHGAGYGWAAISIFLFSIVMWEVVSFRLMRYTAKLGNVLTLPSYFGRRFREKRNVIRSITAGLLFSGCIFLGAFLISTAANAFGKVLSLDDTLATVGITLIAIGGLFFAGFHSTYRQNMVRIILIFAALVGGCLLIFGYLGTRGIFTNIMRSWSQGSVSEYINALYMGGEHLSVKQYVNLGTFGMILFGFPGFYMHFMSVRSGKIMNSAKRTATVFRMFFLFFGCVFGGLLRAFLFPERFKTLQVNYDVMLETILKRFIDRGLLGTIFGILFILAVLSVLLSFIESLLLTAASVMYEDILINSFWSGRERGDGLLNLKLIMVLSALLEGFIAMMMQSTAYKAAAVILIVFASSIGVPLVLSLYRKKMTGKVCLFGIISGIILPLLYIFLPVIEQGDKTVSLYERFDVSPILIAVVGNYILITFVGHFAKQKDDQILKIHEDVKNRIV